MLSFESSNVDKGSFSPTRHDDDNEDTNNLESKPSEGNSVSNGNHSVKPTMLQRGVLRTNCIDCLDRTNVAQYAYGLAALGHQLHALGVIDHPRIDLDDPVADGLMGFYERMGDTLAHQYGGSAAHNKVICSCEACYNCFSLQIQILLGSQYFCYMIFFLNYLLSHLNVFL